MLKIKKSLVKKDIKSKRKKVKEGKFAQEMQLKYTSWQTNKKSRYEVSFVFLLIYG